MGMSILSDLRIRPRRLRRTPAMRALVRETIPAPGHLVAPLFVLPPGSPSQPIDSLPGHQRLHPDDLLREFEELRTLGIHACALFPVVPAELKNNSGTHAWDDSNFLHALVPRLKKQFPDMVLFLDVALDPYTTHGHDGVLGAGGDVDNDATVEALARMAIAQAAAGADFVAPSDMMDGRIGAIRSALDRAGHTGTGILSYAAKFASAYYGPFRDAVGSSLTGGYLDKQTYQLQPSNPRDALRDALLDEAEGADILMVKPAGHYLDILHALRDQTRLPLAAYQVSGEFAQIHAAARAGWLALAAARDESLLAIQRAGADIIFTYFAKDAARDWSKTC